MSRGILRKNGIHICLILLSMAAILFLWKKEQIYDAFCGKQDGEMVSVVYEGEPLVFDEGSRTFFLPVDVEKGWEQVDFAKLLTEPTGKPVFTKKSEHAQLEKLKKDSLKEAVSENKKYSFFPDKKEDDQAYYVTFTGLPVLNLEIPEILNLEEIDEQPETGELTLRNTQLSGEIIRSGMTVNVRGGITRQFDKKSYKLCLTRSDGKDVKKNPKSLLDLRVDDEWILLPMYYDKSKIRDKFNIEIWNSFGPENYPYTDCINFGTRMEYLELFVNGEYAGLYGLLEPVDEKQIGISSNAAGGLQDHLYKKVHIESVDLAAFTVESGALVRCGYEIKGKDKSGSAESFAPLLTFLELYKEKDDAVFCDRAAEVCSTDNVIDFWIQLQLISGEDNLGKNYYCVLRMENGKFRTYFVPWDMDLTWGDTFAQVPTGEAEEGPEGVAHGVQFVHRPELMETILEQNFLNRYILLDTDGAWGKLQARWSELRGTVLSEDYLFEKMDSYITEIHGSGAMLRNGERWPDVETMTDYTELKNFVSGRLEFLDAYILEE